MNTTSRSFNHLSTNIPNTDSSNRLLTAYGLRVYYPSLKILVDAYLEKRRVSRESERFQHRGDN